MKSSDTQKFVVFLRSLTTDQLDKLQSNLLNEMRQRDSEQVKGDVLANSKALGLLRSRSKPSGK